jgi:hypothetical protein
MGSFAWRPPFPEALRREETVNPTRPIGSGLPGRVASSPRISNALNHDCIELGALLLIGDGIVGLIIFIGRFVESKAPGRTLGSNPPIRAAFPALLLLVNVSRSRAIPGATSPCFHAAGRRGNLRSGKSCNRGR